MSDLWLSFVGVWSQVVAFLAPLDPLGQVLSFVIVAVLGYGLLRSFLRLAA